MVHPERPPSRNRDVLCRELLQASRYVGWLPLVRRSRGNHQGDHPRWQCTLGVALVRPRRRACDRRFAAKVAGAVWRRSARRNTCGMRTLHSRRKTRRGGGLGLYALFERISRVLTRRTLSRTVTGAAFFTRRE